jgi:hypothetical protein
LAIKEMQIKITVRFHLTPVTIGTTNNNIGKDAGKKQLSYTAGWNVS